MGTGEGQEDKLGGWAEERQRTESREDGNQKKRSSGRKGSRARAALPCWRTTRVAIVSAERRSCLPRFTSLTVLAGGGLAPPPALWRTVPQQAEVLCRYVPAEDEKTFRAGTGRLMSEQEGAANPTGSSGHKRSRRARFMGPQQAGFAGFLGTMAPLIRQVLVQLLGDAPDPPLLFVWFSSGMLSHSVGAPPLSSRQEKRMLGRISLFG